MTLYRTRPGDSPLRIARSLGTSVASLIAANPHKPTTVVAGKHTWRGLHHNERVNVPFGIGMVGAITPAAPGAPHAMIRKGSSGPDVALWQTIIGATADGIFGPKTDTLTRSWQSTHGLASDGIVGPKTWAAALGSAAPVTVATPMVAPAPMTTPSSNLSAIANSALSALRSDPNYCASVARTGTAVNTAVHNFKAAWNAANPSRAVPIGTGKYEPSVSAALWSALGGTVDVPPGCGVAGAAPPPPPIQAPVAPSAPAQAPPVAMPAPPPMPPAPSGPGVPPAVLALTSIDPCDQGSAAVVTQAQQALGVSADGKYGNDTANAARRLVPNAPAACSPRPMWWSPPGSSSAAGPSAPAPSSGGGGGIAPPPPPVAPPPISSGGPLVAPVEKKLSTGAIVAGAVGAAALVGLLAAAAMSKKPGHRGARGARGPARRKSAHKAKRKSSKRKRK